MEPTKIVQKPMNKDVKEGTKVKFDATVKGKPVPEVTWFKNEEKLEPTDKLKIDTKEVRGDVLTALVMESVTLDDIGDYKIYGKNPAGEDTYVAKLNVQSKSCSLVSATGRDVS